MLKRCFTMIYSTSYRSLDENILARALMFEIFPDSEMKILDQSEYFNVGNFKKPSGKLLSLMSQFEPKVPGFSLSRLMILIKLLGYYDTTNLKFYELVLDNFQTKTGSMIKSQEIHQSVLMHYICFGDRSSKNYNWLMDKLLLRINIRSKEDFFRVADLIKLKNSKNLEADKLSNLLQMMIVIGKAYDIEVVLQLFREFYKYSMTYKDFYYPIAEHLINCDNVLTPTKLEIFLSLLNISPDLQTINLLKRQLEVNVFINNSNLAKLFFRCYLLLPQDSLLSEEIKEFLSSLIRVFKKNFVDYEDNKSLNDVKLIYFVCFQLKLMKYDKEHTNIAKILKTKLPDNMSSTVLEQELKKITKWK